MPCQCLVGLLKMEDNENKFHVGTSLMPFVFTHHVRNTLWLKSFQKLLQIVTKLLKFKTRDISLSSLLLNKKLRKRLQAQVLLANA